MKVLFITCQDHDYIAACTWDGLQDVFGEGQIYDVVDAPALHFSHGNPCARVGGHRLGEHGLPPEPCDLLVLHACFLREQTWEWVQDLCHHHLKPNAKKLFIEGWDNSEECYLPPMPMDAVFRRELNPSITYPYAAHCLSMAAPRRWFVDDLSGERHIDVFYAAHSLASNERWDVCSKIFQSTTRHKAIVGSCDVSFDRYFDYLKHSKLAVCPTGACCCADCLRTWEVVSQGAIPIFVGYPPYIREPWFADDEIFWCHSADELPGIIDKALAPDFPLEQMRAKMFANALANHTTKARMERMLRIVGMTLSSS